jgi:hypothetical protein
VALVRSASPRWEAAAQRLVSALAAQPDSAARSRLLERVAGRFGSAHYLSFVQLLCAVEQFGDPAARTVVADALAGAIASGRVPSGTVPAWGAASPRPAAPGTAGAGGRPLGPIEFVCAALLQPGVTPAAGAADAEFALRRLVSLLNASPRAAVLYAARLRSHAGDPLEGALSRRTRATLDALGAHWTPDEPPERMVRRAIAAALAPAR